MLAVKNLNKAFGGIQAVRDCSFAIEEGKITGLIGPNGAGKTTVFNLITGFSQPDSGQVLLDKTDITGMQPDKIFTMGISRTFQLIRLFPKMTVLENMMLAMKDQNEQFWHALLQLPSMKKEEQKNAAHCLEMLKFVDLHVKHTHLARELSYGQQKLLEIGRALVSEPEVLLLDEPAAGVNPTMLNKIKQLLRELHGEGKTILLIEHDMDFVMNMCDHVIVLDYGKVIASGTPKHVQKNKRVLDAYLGGME